MPSFEKGGGFRTPFGTNNYLRSTQDVKYDHGTFAAASLPTETIDGSVEKILQRGTVLAKIVSGDDAGKLGAFQTGATDGRADTANIVGIVDTFLPWQLLHHDEVVAYAYDASVVQGWCFELNSSGVRIPLTNATAAAMRSAKKLNILFS